MIVYAALHCSNTHEGMFKTISTHRTNEGALVAINKSKSKELERFHERWTKEEAKEGGYIFGLYQSWVVQEIRILD